MPPSGSTEVVYIHRHLRRTGSMPPYGNPPGKVRKYGKVRKVQGIAGKCGKVWMMQEGSEKYGKVQERILSIKNHW